MYEELTKHIADLKEPEALADLNKHLEAGGDPMALLNACQAGMVMVGQEYEKGNYYISDLMMAGEVFKQVCEILAPKLGSDTGEGAGKVVMGTVEGDIHDIGKDLVVGMLRAANYDVIDLGVDVPVQNFIDALKDSGAKVLALSGLLTIAFDAMKKVVELADQEGLRDTVKIMIGGGPINEDVCKYTGADAWGADAQAAVKICNEWMGV